MRDSHLMGTVGRAAALRTACEQDGELRMAARYWTGSVRFDLGDEVITLAFEDGRLADAASGDQPAITLTAPPAVWDEILQPVPAPFRNDIVPAQAFGLQIGGDPEAFWQYYPAVRRMVDLLREAQEARR